MFLHGAEIDRRCTTFSPLGQRNNSRVGSFEVQAARSFRLTCNDPIDDPSIWSCAVQGGRPYRQGGLPADQGHGRSRRRGAQRQAQHQPVGCALLQRCRCSLCEFLFSTSMYEYPEGFFVFVLIFNATRFFTRSLLLYR